MKKKIKKHFAAKSTATESAGKRIREIISRVFAEVASKPLSNAQSLHRPKSGEKNIAGYDLRELASLPLDAVARSLGCGNPLAFSAVEEGDTVLDLGCGAGTDLLLAAKKVGPSGRVIGVDMVDEMLVAARAVTAESGFTHVEVRKGLIEELPVESASIDWVISNSTIQLSPEPERIFAEIVRVLEPGGQVSIADKVVEELSAEQKKDLGLSCSSVKRFMSEQAYLDRLRHAGLVDVAIRERIENDHEETKAKFRSNASKLDAQNMPELAELAELAARVAARSWNVVLYARKPG